jgi:hypothetical protein
VAGDTQACTEHVETLAKVGVTVGLHGQQARPSFKSRADLIMG